MADRGEPPYDPYIPAEGGAPAGAAAQQNGGNQRTAALQAVGLFFLVKVDERLEP